MTKSFKKFISSFIALIKAAPERLAYRAFLTFIILLCFFVLLGGAIFYQYVLVAEKKEPEPDLKLPMFQKGVYNNVLDAWSDREQRFLSADSKEHPSPFKSAE